ncbi:thiol:disulfide interchange protein [Bacteroides reticulotermitis JCM 10512]|uniref:Thiol:disulfide interchange protein n=2 Tax=Bacteroides reticulotermitis TaxID=1133319 RepID=W4UQ04_9BACE|nr:thiol:disulfide interchange protein [Bacteroides reticulotermitis JCM 10512]
MLSCQSQPATSYTITGNLEGLPEGARVQLVPISHDDEKPLVDTVAVHGKFTFKGSAKEPLLVGLSINDMYGRYAFMLENGKLMITGKVTVNKQGDNTFAQFADMKVVGSPLTTEYLKKINVREQMDSIYKANAEKFKDINEALTAARGAKDKAKLDSLATTEAIKRMVKPTRSSLQRSTVPIRKL